jgi:hypothetical protein
MMKFKLVFNLANNSFHKEDANFTSIRYHHFRNTMQSKNLFHEYFNNVNGIKSRLYRNKVCRLTKFIDYHHN